MTGKMMLDSAVINLGYTKSDDIFEAGLTFINQVCADICSLTGRDFYPANSLSDVLAVPENLLTNVGVYGLAMYIALYRGDGDKNQFYATLYNQKRRLLSTSTAIVDSLPRGED